MNTTRNMKIELVRNRHTMVNVMPAPPDSLPRVTVSLSQKKSLSLLSSFSLSIHHLF